MINFKRLSEYCCENISLIENYEQAVSDENEVWQCHHRLETDKGISRNELIANSMYYNRPASELIFMRRIDHQRLHSICGDYPKHWLGKFGAEHIRSIPIVQLSKDGQFIRKWQAARDVERELGINHRTIALCCKGKRNYSGGFRWVYAKDYRRTISEIKPLF